LKENTLHSCQFNSYIFIVTDHERTGHDLSLRNYNPGKLIYFNEEQEEKL